MAASRTTAGSIQERFSHLDLHSASAIVFFTGKGLKSSLFYDFADSIKMSVKNLAVLLNVSSRTLSNYKEQKKNLEPVQGEHLLKLIALFRKGEEVFGNVDEFNYWLQKPFWNANERRIDWLVAPGGVRPGF